MPFYFNAVPFCLILLFPQRSEPVCLYHSSFVVIAAMMLIIPRVHHTRRHPHCHRCPRPHDSKVTSEHSLHPVNDCLASLKVSEAGEDPARIATCVIQTCEQQQRVVLRPSLQMLLRRELLSVPAWSNTTGEKPIKGPHCSFQLVRRSSSVVHSCKKEGIYKQGYISKFKTSKVLLDIWSQNIFWHIFTKHFHISPASQCGTPSIFLIFRSVVILTP